MPALRDSTGTLGSPMPGLPMNPYDQPKITWRTIIGMIVVFVGLVAIAALAYW